MDDKCLSDRKMEEHDQPCFVHFLYLNLIMYIDIVHLFTFTTSTNRVQKMIKSSSWFLGERVWTWRTKTWKVGKLFRKSLKIGKLFRKSWKVGQLFRKSWIVGGKLFRKSSEPRTPLAGSSANQGFHWRELLSVQEILTF